MGQYYNPVIIKKNGRREVYSRDLDGEYTMAKLTEHSWFDNTMVNTFAMKLFRNPQRVAWVGDYADDYKNYKEEIPNSLDYKLVKSLHRSAWKYGDGREMTACPLNMRNCILINHTKRQYINMREYYKECDKLNKNDYCKGWVQHPLPLLTALGNGFGGGDYRGMNENLIGYWACDEIEFDTNDREGYSDVTKELIFNENAEEEE